MTPTLGDITPRLKLEESKWYEIEAYQHSSVKERTSDYGPVYEIEVLHKNEAYILAGGAGLIDNLLPLVRGKESMVPLRVMKEWFTDPESGDKSMLWFVEAVKSA